MGLMVAPILGPTVGGWITDNWNWRWNFYINLPIGAIAFLMVSAFVHDPCIADAATREDASTTSVSFFLVLSPSGRYR